MAQKRQKIDSFVPMMCKWRVLNPNYVASMGKWVLDEIGVKIQFSIFHPLDSQMTSKTAQNNRFQRDTAQKSSLKSRNKLLSKRLHRIVL